MQTGEGRAGGEAGPGLGYREVKRWEEEAEYRKLRILAEGTSHVVSMLQDSQHSPPPPPHFPLVPFLSSKHWTPGSPLTGQSLQEQVPSLGTPTATGGGGLRPKIPPTSGGAEIPRRLTHHSQLGRKENTWDGSKSSSQVLYEHDYQILANSVAGHGLKHQQKY